MTRREQIEEMTCEKCLHYEGCLKRFREAKKDGRYELIDEEEYFAHADECDFFITGYRKQSEGEWIYHEAVMSDEGLLSGYTCSHCSAFIDEELYEHTSFSDKYCPNCGAKMKGR